MAAKPTSELSCAMCGGPVSPGYTVSCIPCQDVALDGYQISDEQADRAAALLSPLVA